MIEINHLELYTNNKIISLKGCATKVEELKKEGKKIGMCHGGFDLTHPGHFKHFEMAKKTCDFLIVSITADKFVTSRKGSGRPIYTDKLRAYIIACNENVDFVVISPYRKGTEIIEAIKPSYYIKGPDFINKTTPGITSERESIKKVGGEMKYTTEPPMSTTKIITYIREKVNNDEYLLVLDRDGTLIENNDFLGKNNNWKDEIKLKKEVIDFIINLQTKYKLTTVGITNQAGVARNYFSEETVKEINETVSKLLKEKNIIINTWEYAPCVETKYSKTRTDIEWNQKYVKETTDRKPSDKMVIKALKTLNKDIKSFKKIIVIGDRHEDENLAKNLNAIFFDANKTYEDLLNNSTKKLGN